MQPSSSVTKTVQGPSQAEQQHLQYRREQVQYPACPPCRAWRERGKGAQRTSHAASRRLAAPACFPCRAVELEADRGGGGAILLGNGCCDPPHRFLWSLRMLLRSLRCRRAAGWRVQSGWANVARWLDSLMGRPFPRRSHAHHRFIAHNASSATVVRAGALVSSHAPCAQPTKHPRL